MLLVARQQDEGWVKLAWKPPVDDGRPSAYRVVRRERPARLWSHVATAVLYEAMLLDQPRGKECEYKAIAVNKADEREVSNTVLAVL